MKCPSHLIMCTATTCSTEMVQKMTHCYRLSLQLVSNLWKECRRVSLEDELIHTYLPAVTDTHETALSPQNSMGIAIDISGVLM